MNKRLFPILATVALLFAIWHVGNWILAKPVVPNNDDVALAKSMRSSLDELNGLCVHLNPKDGGLTTLLSDGRYLVHGLCANDAIVEDSRKRIRQAKLEGIVSVERGAFDQLTYADRIANMVVIDDLPSLLTRGLTIKEVVRVVRPGGVLWLGQRESHKGDSMLDEKQLTDLLAKSDLDQFKVLKDGGIWARVQIPRPDDMDTWTHKRRGPTGNPVSTDNYIGLPSGIRWVAGPNWPTGGRKSVMHSVVANEDRLVYVFEDESETADGPRRHNSLVARDAFNGLRLWNREIGGSTVLTSAGDRIYTVLNDSGSLVAIDAKTGDIVHEFKDAGRPKQITHVDGNLLIDMADGLASLDAASGKQNWKYPNAPAQFVVGDGHVFVHAAARDKSGERVSQFVSLDVATGKPEWQAATKTWSKSTPNLLFYQEDILVAASSDGNHGVSAKDGSHLWNYNYPRIGHGGSFEKVLYMHDLVWIHTAQTKGTRQYAWEGLDPQTGEIKKRVIQPADFAYKHRCSYDVATQRYFVCGSMDFADVESGEYSHFTAARNSCRLGGVVPANGLLYTFPHACGCFPMLRGFLGLADTPDPNLVTVDTAGARLEKGPAYDDALSSEGSSGTDWPTYRHDNVRSGSTTAAGPPKLEKLWSVDVASDVSSTLSAEWDLKDGGRMTSPVIAEGFAFAASTDDHRLDAYDATNGELRWQFTATGRIDCPPTIWAGLCLFGSRDGWAYCLRVSDGELLWRFRAAPEDRRVVAYGQLESPWPVVGGVLVYDGLAYFVAGRHEGADGGVFVHAVNPTTGKMVWAKRPRDYPGVPDVLNGADGNVQMASYVFDAKTGDKKSDETRLRGGRLGLLNDAWYKRPIAMRKNLQLWTGKNKAGQLFSFSPDATCGYRACKSVSGGDGKMSGDATLFGIPEKGGQWQIDMPNTSRMKGVVIAADRLYVAGKLEVDGDLHNVVRAYSLGDGRPLAQYRVKDQFIHDCMAVAGGRVYVTTQGGQMICLGER